METSEASTVNPSAPGNVSLDRPNPPSTSACSDTNEQKYREAFANACRCIAPQMRSFEEELSRQLTSDNAPIDRVLKYVARLGGKRLRPALTFLTAELFGPTTDETMRLAMVVELVHTATLVHDDVLDDSGLRRHQPTVHVRWDIPTSILIGDWLFTHAYGLANAGESTLPGRWIASAAKRVCEGEIRQNQSIANWELSQEEYFEILSCKTGALCGASCAMGAWSTAAPITRCEALQSFGNKLGLAFQIFDDWLDIWGDQAPSGKTLGTDFEHDKPTLPWIYLLGNLSPADRQAWLEKYHVSPSHAKAELMEMLKQSDASAYTLGCAKGFAQSACEDLRRAVNGFDLSQRQSQALKALEEIAKASVARIG
ncbi:MAG: polyprenyl synthetase family protein [Planctomycetes bacterium]|nr:polyprenyl synthetase family protein [Planctomycetota bacterium]